MEKWFKTWIWFLLTSDGVTFCGVFNNGHFNG